MIQLGSFVSVKETNCRGTVVQINSFPSTQFLVWFEDDTCKWYAQEELDMV